MRIFLASLCLGALQTGFAAWPTPQPGDHIENEFQMLQPSRLRIATPDAAATYSLAVSPLLIDDDGVVTLSFSSSNASRGDWIGAYSPVPTSDANLSLTVPIKLAWCDRDPGYLTSGSGTLRMQLTAAYRAPVAFYYFTGQFVNQTLVGRAPQPVSFTAAALTAPLLPRVMPSGDPDVVRIVWGSLNATQPTVRVGAHAWARSPIGGGSVCAHPSHPTSTPCPLTAAVGERVRGARPDRPRIFGRAVQI